MAILFAAQHLRRDTFARRPTAFGPPSTNENRRFMIAPKMAAKSAVMLA